jgi:hypothetical protein
MVSDQLANAWPAAGARVAFASTGLSHSPGLACAWWSVFIWRWGNAGGDGRVRRRGLGLV